MRGCSAGVVDLQGTRSAAGIFDLDRIARARDAGADVHAGGIVQLVENVLHGLGAREIDGETALDAPEDDAGDALVFLDGDLADDRPSPARLTEFYFWISLGGMLGGLFNALLAPVIFTGIVEYPLVLIVACLVRRATSEPSTRRA